MRKSPASFSMAPWDSIVCFATRSAKVTLPTISSCSSREFGASVGTRRGREDGRDTQGVDLAAVVGKNSLEDLLVLVHQLQGVVLYEDVANDVFKVDEVEQGEHVAFHLRGVPERKR